MRIVGVKVVESWVADYFESAVREAIGEIEESGGSVLHLKCERDVGQDTYTAFITIGRREELREVGT